MTSRTTPDEILKHHGDREEIKIFLQYIVGEPEFDVEEICSRLKEDFNLSPKKTRKLIRFYSPETKTSPRRLRKPKLTAPQQKSEPKQKTRPPQMAPISFPGRSKTQAQASETQESDDDRTCFICTEESDYWALANCGHKCCARCAVKSRWTFNYLGKARLKQKPKCPICRQVWKRICIGKWGMTLDDFTNKRHPYDKELKCTYQTRQERAHFHRLLEMRCPVCQEPKDVFRSLDSLTKHLRNKHGSYLCILCLDNTQLFLDEHIVYESKHALERHRLEKHPQCRLCKRFNYDEDTLKAHIKNDHHQCPACPDLAFVNLNAAKDHFRSRHFLCERGACARGVQLFLSEQEFQEHVQTAHQQQQAKSRKPKRKPRMAKGGARTRILEEMGELVTNSLTPDLVIYHQMLFSVEIDAQKFFKSFRECWESCAPFEAWESFWLMYLKTLENHVVAGTYYDLYRAYCYDSTFDNHTIRWSPLQNQNSTFSQSQNSNVSGPPLNIQRQSSFPELSTGQSSFPTLSTAQRSPQYPANTGSQPAPARMKYGPWSSRRPRRITKPNQGPQPTNQKTQLRGAWAPNNHTQVQYAEEPQQNEKRKKKKKKKKNRRIL